MTTQQNNTTEVKPLTTEVQKMDWLNNEINRLEDLLESGCADSDNKNVLYRCSESYFLLKWLLAGPMPSRE